MRELSFKIAFFLIFILTISNVVDSTRNLKSKVLKASSDIAKTQTQFIVTVSNGTSCKPAASTTISTPSTTTTTTTTPTTTASTPSTTPTTTTTTVPTSTTTTTSTTGTQWFDCKLAVNVPGSDIADNPALYPDPFLWYTNTAEAGVTLIGPSRASKCGWAVGKNFLWDSNWNTCILNGQGYPLEWSSPACGNGKYSAAVTPASYITLFTNFQSYALNKAQKLANPDGSTAYLTSLVLDGKPIQAAMSIGHGVLNGLCGDCFLINQGSSYVALLQTDVRAWSLELSGGANVYLAADNVGGTCYIPKVTPISCSLLMP